jgi:hypothetical protein
VSYRRVIWYGMVMVGKGMVSYGKVWYGMVWKCEPTCSRETLPRLSYYMQRLLVRQASKTSTREKAS